MKHTTKLLLLTVISFVAFAANPVLAFAGDTAQNSQNLDELKVTNEERDRQRNCDGRTDAGKCLRENPIVEWTLRAINFLSIGVGLVVTIMIIVGGIQYATAGPNPQVVAAAKQKIANALIALLAYFFLFAFLQWLVPGGIF